MRIDLNGSLDNLHLILTGETQAESMLLGQLKSQWLALGLRAYSDSNHTYNWENGILYLRLEKKDE